jgi:hypothetical protein
MWVLQLTSAFAHIQDQADDSDILPLVILFWNRCLDKHSTFTSATATALYWNKITRNSVNPSQQITPCGLMMSIVLQVHYQFQI